MAEHLRLAFIHAGIDPADVQLRILGPRPGYRGKAWPAGVPAWGEQDALGEHFAAFDSSDGRRMQRIALWFESPLDALAAILRHELEHLLQFKEHGLELQDLHDQACHALRTATGGSVAGRFYNAIPMEADANAAAAAFAVSCFGSARVAELVAENIQEYKSLLTCRTGQSIETLPLRMEGFISGGAEALVRADSSAGG